VRLTHELHAKGQYILASPLEAASTATTVRVRDGKQHVTSGPYAETREVLGGFYLIGRRAPKRPFALPQGIRGRASERSRCDRSWRSRACRKSASMGDATLVAN
jgi:hypothetical protein